LGSGLMGAEILPFGRSRLDHQGAEARRATLVVLACADAHKTTSPTFTCGGRVTAQTTASATSSGFR